MGFEATGLIDGKLPTVGVWAKMSDEVRTYMSCRASFRNHPKGSSHVLYVTVSVLLHVRECLLTTSPKVWCSTSVRREEGVSWVCSPGTSLGKWESPSRCVKICLRTVLIVTVCHRTGSLSGPLSNQINTSTGVY